MGTKDLFSAIEYNLNGLFYDVSNHQILSFSYYDFLKNGIQKINSGNNIENGRELK